MDEAAKKATLHVEESFDTDGDGVADIERRRVLSGSMSLLHGDLKSGGTVIKENFAISRAGQQIYAEDTFGSGKISSLLEFSWTDRGVSMSGEKDLNGDSIVDKKLSYEAGKVRISCFPLDENGIKSSLTTSDVASP